MATVSASNIEINVVSLADVELSKLEDLFDEQCEEWLSLLRWDYSGPSHLIRDVARQRELTGFAATVGRDVIGLAFYVVEGSRCSIGDIYVSSEWRGTGVDRRLALAVLEYIETVPGVRRIESQCLSIGTNGAAELFTQRGFERFHRLYMSIDLNSPPSPKQRSDSIDSLKMKPRDVSIKPWSDADFSRAAQAIHASYVGEPDGLINGQYRTEQGCAELMSILTDTLWCGKFLPEKSLVVVGRSGNLAGVLIASRIAHHAAHIGQISIVPAFQGLGLGRRLIDRTVAGFRQSGFDCVSLAVTKENSRALRLYESCGFQVAHSFPVFFHEW